MKRIRKINSEPLYNSILNYLKHGKVYKKYKKKIRHYIRIGIQIYNQLYQERQIRGFLIITKNLIYFLKNQNYKEMN